MMVLSIVIGLLCVNFSVASETYKAGVIHLQNKGISEHTPLIYKAGNTGVDILVLPSLEHSATDNYDEILNVISRAAKQAGLYVAIHLFEKAKCQLGYEMVRSNLVFDRKGSVVAVKPQNSAANCTVSDSELVTFTTDFGVTFGVLMEEDLVLYDVENLSGLKNFVLTGDWHSELAFLNAVNFAPSWSFINNANLVSTSGIYAGKSGLKTGPEDLAIAVLNKNGGNDKPAVPSISPMKTDFPAEDLSQFVVMPLDVEASSKGLRETVCHRGFCCEFYVKTGAGSNSKSSYSLAALNGIRSFSADHNIGAQICGMFSNSKTSDMKKDVMFEKLFIAANFTQQNAQYPIVQTSAVVPTEKFNFETKSSGICQQATLEITDTQNVINIGILGKNKNAETNYVFNEKNNTENVQSDIYEYIFNEDVQEFVDYVWIRLRVLIVVVSIYILEMM